jgi:hypothetical protein
MCLFTGARSERNIRMYEAAGYHLEPAPADELGAHIAVAVYLSKTVEAER